MGIGKIFMPLGLKDTMRQQTFIKHAKDTWHL